MNTWVYKIICVVRINLYLNLSAHIFFLNQCVCNNHISNCSSCLLWLQSGWLCVNTLSVQDILSMIFCRSTHFKKFQFRAQSKEMIGFQFIKCKHGITEGGFDSWWKNGYLFTFNLCTFRIRTVMYNVIYHDIFLSKLSCIEYILMPDMSDNMSVYFDLMLIVSFAALKGYPGPFLSTCLVLKPLNTE